jgi:chemotaxis protein MotA
MMQANQWKNYARAPIIGAGLGLLLVLGSIILTARSLFAFFSLEGLFIVVGGVIAVAFMSFKKEDVQKALEAISDMYKKPEPKPDNLEREMRNILAWARLLKEKGLRGLEGAAQRERLDDPFVKYGLNMVVSGYEPDEIRAMMETAADAQYDRSMPPVDVLDAMTSHAPAFGMVGTLVGMVMMLCQLGDDYNMNSIGSSLAVSFLSTLYGVLSARMVYMPAGAKLRQSIETIRHKQQMIVEGMVLLAGGKTPMHMQDRLNSFLRPEKRDYYNIFEARPTIVRPRLKVVGA